MKKSYLLILLLLSSFLMFSKAVNKKTAIEVARNFMILKRPNAVNEILNIKENKVGEKIAFYIINFNKDGWIVISGDDQVTPILAYGLHGNLYDNDSTSVIKNFIKNSRSRVENLTLLKTTTNQETKNNQEIRTKWDKYLNTNGISMLKSGSFNNNILDTDDRGEIRWKQSGNNDGGCAPYQTYNKFMEDVEDCNLCGDKHSVGCGAVAAGQIMWYWQWPYKSDYRTYNWGNMPNKLTNSSSESEGTEIANLLKDIGRSDAANMHYWCTGSWTTQFNLHEALSEDFGYQAAELKDRDDWDYTSWKELIRTEINVGRPVLYRGGDVIDFSNFGDVHYFVCDGYDIDEPHIFHFNFGWGETIYKDGYFQLNDITPGGIDESDYTVYQSAIIGLSPTYAHISCNSYLSDIANLSYSSVLNKKLEVALNTITVPAVNKSLSVESGGDLELKAGSLIVLKPGFTAKIGSSLNASVGAIDCDKECGIELNCPVNAIIYGSEINGRYIISGKNTNSYEVIIWSRNQDIVYRNAGLMGADDEYIKIWSGEGVTYEGVYVADITIRNNCGEKISQSKDITVLSSSLFKSDSTTQYVFPSDFQNSSNKPEPFNNSNIESSSESIDNDVDKFKYNFVNINISPNPTSGIISIAGLVPASRIEVVDENGRSIMIEENTDSSIKLDLSNNANGVYFINVTNPLKEPFTERIVLKK
ncbi:MAG: thiol protease/hemagglutinin PrtT [Bacteroidales bacterium]|nr:thiol protease/hemagglutinin PrtT [Bacteroidales bacterium]